MRISDRRLPCPISRPVQSHSRPRSWPRRSRRSHLGPAARAWTVAGWDNLVIGGPRSPPRPRMPRVMVRFAVQLRMGSLIPRRTRSTKPLGSRSFETPCNRAAATCFSPPRAPGSRWRWPIPAPGAARATTWLGAWDSTGSRATRWPPPMRSCYSRWATSMTWSYTLRTRCGPSRASRWLGSSSPRRAATLAPTRRRSTSTRQTRSSRSTAGSPGRRTARFPRS